MGRHGLDSVSSNAWEEHYELPVRGIRPNKRMKVLFENLTKENDPSRRLQVLAWEMRLCPQVFSEDQVLSLAPYFPTNYLLALHLLDDHILGFHCAQVAQILNLFPDPIKKLDALTVCSQHIIDPINRNNLVSSFPYNFQQQVISILGDVKGKSHTYGNVRGERAVFLIDTSGSMGTEFRTDCGEDFNRLEFVVHDLHKILHHRVKKNFMFNIISFSSEAHKWNSKLTPATKEHLKKAEHHLDHMEAEGGTNTHDALKMAILHEEDADTVYLLSDGEPTHGNTDMNSIINDVKSWINKRKRPITIHTIAFLMGHPSNDPTPRRFMAKLASLTPEGVFRCCDPFSQEDEEYIRDGLTSSSTFDQDPTFASYFAQKITQIPQFNSMPNQLTIQPQLFPTIDYKLISMQRVRTPQDILIPKSEELKGHTLYSIEINIKDLFPNNKVLSWTVKHSFDDFEKLHHHMKNHISQKKLSDKLKLPASTLFHHSDAHFVEQRRIQLEAYIKLMYVSFYPGEFSDLDLFLMYDTHLSQAITEQRILDQQNLVSQSSGQPTQFPPNVTPNSQQFTPQLNTFNAQPQFNSQQPPYNLPPYSAQQPYQQQASYTQQYTYTNVISTNSLNPSNFIAQPTSPYQQTASNQPTSPYQQPLVPQPTSPYQQPASNQPTSPYQQPLVPQPTFPYQQTASNQPTSPYQQPSVPQPTSDQQSTYQQPASNQPTSPFQQPSVPQPTSDQQSSPYQQPSVPQPTSDQQSSPYQQPSVPQPTSDQQSSPYQQPSVPQPTSDQQSSPYQQPSVPQPTSDQPASNQP